MTDDPKMPEDVAQNRTPDRTPMVTQDMIDDAIRQKAMAIAATQTGQQHLNQQGALGGLYGGTAMMPEVHLRSQCLQSVINIGIREPELIIKTAQAFYDFMVDKPKTATLHAVKP